MNRLIRHALSIICMICISAALSGCASVETIDDKKEADYYYKMGLSYFNEGKMQTAFVQLQKALQYDSSNKDVLNSLGLVYMNLDENAKAIETFQRATSSDPSFSDAYNNMGVAYMRAGQYKEAIAAFEKAISNPLYETPEKAYYNMGDAYYRTKDFQKALNSYRSSAIRAPQFALPFFRMALAYNKLARYGDAASALATGLRLEPAYNGSKEKFESEIRTRLASVSGEEAADLQDYLEILKY
ncbi:MAG: tetratricopeptide repeat protein [Nitrospiraceae bacterium]|nr:tetratricopeptide repeat protein [Nitrospiraceae bacterium]